MHSSWNDYFFPQNKVEDAEQKKGQSQEQLDSITQQLSELQSTCSELKAKVQQQNKKLQSSEVSVSKPLIKSNKWCDRHHHYTLRPTLQCRFSNVCAIGHCPQM